MPELPDVESFKRYFNRTSLGQEIADIQSDAKSLVKKIVFGDFKQKLLGRQFRKASRRGKFLIVKIENIPQKLILHFGMTGSLHYVKQGSPRKDRDRFAHLIFKFKNGYELRWNNQRKLGKVYLLENPEDLDLIQEMGPEPLEISKKEFLKLLKEHSRKSMKGFFLDQRVIAGIGNIYSDEILFRAKIDPHRKAKSLDLKEKKKVFKKMQKVLKEASKLNHPDAQFPDSWLIPHRRKGEKCPQNKNHELKREIIVGRASYFCPICQK